MIAIDLAISVRRVGTGDASVVEGSNKEKSLVYRFLRVIGISFVAAFFIRTFIVQAFKIPSGSMLPTLQIGDHILVNKLAYGIRVPFGGRYIVHFGKPRSGDVVVFVYPLDRSRDFVKRVIGEEGDEVEIRNKKVYVNGEPLDDPHAFFEDDAVLQGGFRTGDTYGPTHVPEGNIFVMGDNRDRSADSRSWGFVNLSAVKGKAFVVYWSWDRTDRGVRWERLGHFIY